jgi:methyltransferase (TIGR00027 family)
MQPVHFSKTAMGTAFIRAYHAAHDHPKIFDDFWAHRLITASEYQIIEERQLKMFLSADPEQAARYPERAGALAGWMQSGAPQPIVLARARYAEDHLEQAVSQQGVKQYVILGAGMDTFAYRRPDLLAHLQVFEVDHPATQSFKRQRLREMEEEPPARLHFVPVDLNQEDLAAALRRSAFDPLALSFFSWLGVTYYLTREAVNATLQAIAEMAPKGSAVIFDYLDFEAFVPEKAARRVQMMIESVRRLGEPMLSGFEPASLAADLAGLGLRLQENLSPADIQARFFMGRTDGYRACEHAHFARAIVA